MLFKWISLQKKEAFFFLPSFSTKIDLFSQSFVPLLHSSWHIHTAWIEKEFRFSFSHRAMLNRSIQIHHPPIQFISTQFFVLFCFATIKIRIHSFEIENEFFLSSSRSLSLPFFQTQWVVRKFTKTNWKIASLQNRKLFTSLFYSFHFLWWESSFCYYGKADKKFAIIVAVFCILEIIVDKIKMTSEWMHWIFVSTLNKSWHEYCQKHEIWSRKCAYW